MEYKQQRNGNFLHQKLKNNTDGWSNRSFEWRRAWQSYDYNSSRIVYDDKYTYKSKLKAHIQVTNSYIMFTLSILIDTALF